MESEIMKPCPVYNAWGANYPPDLHMLTVRRVFNQRMAVRCECGVTGPSQITEAEAIAAWNKRPVDPVIPEGSEREWRVFPTQDTFKTRIEADDFRAFYAMNGDIQYRTPAGPWQDAGETKS